MPSVSQAADILACLGQATFVDIATDAIAWSANAASIFPNISGETLASGRSSRN